MQTLDLETAAKLSTFAVALLAVAERHSEPPATSAAEAMSVHHLAESSATAERGSARFQLLRDVAGTVAREGYVWTVIDEQLMIAAVKDAFTTVARLLPALDPDARLLAEANADPRSIAEIVVECAGAGYPADFAEAPAGRRQRGERLSQDVTNTIVLRVAIARTLEAVLRHPAAGVVTGAGPVLNEGERFEALEIDAKEVFDDDADIARSMSPPGVGTGRRSAGRPLESALPPLPDAARPPASVAAAPPTALPTTALAQLRAISQVQPAGLPEAVRQRLDQSQTLFSRVVRQGNNAEPSTAARTFPDAIGSAAKHRRAAWIWWTLGLIAVGSALAAWVFRKELAGGGAALLELLRSSTAPPPLRSSGAGDQPEIVDVSAFAPSETPAGSQSLVQVFLHSADQADIARALASESDPDTRRTGRATLATEIRRGQRITVVLDAGSLPVDEPVQHLIWRGTPSACQFFATVPAEAEIGLYPVRAMVTIDNVPVGSVRFRLRVVPRSENRGEVELHGEAARRYRSAFLSYSSQDRAEVLKRAQALKAAGIGFFQDLLNLEPGERWQRRLYQEIERCDLFLLFWSSSAARSEWVTQETVYALTRRNRSVDERPEIAPIILEGPPIPTPPDSLKDIHFNDPIVYVISAIGTERTGHSPGRHHPGS